MLACVIYKTLSLLPLSVGGWTRAIASFNTWFSIAVDTLNALLSATVFIISNSLFTLWPVFAEINIIGA